MNYGVKTIKERGRVREGEREMERERDREREVEVHVDFKREGTEGEGERGRRSHISIINSSQEYTAHHMPRMLTFQVYHTRL